MNKLHNAVQDAQGGFGTATRMRADRSLPRRIATGEAVEAAFAKFRRS
jgi:hypothetical protein